MFALLMILHLLVCIGLISVVLLQSGKGGGLAGGAFGGSAQTVFGGRGATDFITRATMVLGAAFFLTSLSLALMSAGVSRPTRSLIQEEARRTGAASGVVPPASGPVQPSGTPTGQPAVGGSSPAAPPSTAPATAAPGTAAPKGGTAAPAPKSPKPPGGK
jgi:preprotein translocase subunit SecG